MPCGCRSVMRLQPGHGALKGIAVGVYLDEMATEPEHCASARLVVDELQVVVRFGRDARLHQQLAQPARVVQPAPAAAGRAAAIGSTHAGPVVAQRHRDGRARRGAARERQVRGIRGARREVLSGLDKSNRLVVPPSIVVSYATRGCAPADTGRRTRAGRREPQNRQVTAPMTGAIAVGSSSSPSCGIASSRGAFRRTAERRGGGVRAARSASLGGGHHPRSLPGPIIVQEPEWERTPAQDRRRNIPGQPRRSRPVALDELEECLVDRLIRMFATHEVREVARGRALPARRTSRRSRSAPLPHRDRAPGVGGKSPWAATTVRPSTVCVPRSSASSRAGRSASSGATTATLRAEDAAAWSCASGGKVRRPSSFAAWTREISAPAVAAPVRPSAGTPVSSAWQVSFSSGEIAPQAGIRTPRRRADPSRPATAPSNSTLPA